MRWMIRCVAGSFNMLRSWVATFFGSSGGCAGRSRKDHRTFRCMGPTSNGYCRKLTASSAGQSDGFFSGARRIIRWMELFPATFQRLVGVGEAYLSGLYPFIVTLLAVLKCGRPILVPRQVRSSML